MSERSSADSDAVPRLEGLPPAPHAADEFWAVMEAWLEERLQGMMPTMGTVTGRDGGGVKVKLDDEEEARTVGFPRAKGVDYPDGARVWVHKTEGGDRAILGIVDSSQNEAVISDKQLQTDAADSRVIKGGAVEATHLKDREIGYGKLLVDVENRIKASLTEVPGEYVTNDELNEKTQDFITSKDLPEEPDLSGYARKTALNSLEERVAKLEKRVFKNK